MTDDDKRLQFNQAFAKTGELSYQARSWVNWRIAKNHECLGELPDIGEMPPTFVEATDKPGWRIRLFK